MFPEAGCLPRNRRNTDEGFCRWSICWMSTVRRSHKPGLKVAQAQAAPKSASEASVVEMPADLDVQANPDKYAGRKVSWIGAESTTVIVDAHGEQVEGKLPPGETTTASFVTSIPFAWPGVSKRQRQLRPPRRTQNLTSWSLAPSEEVLRSRRSPASRTPECLFQCLWDATIDPLPRR